MKLLLMTVLEMNDLPAGHWQGGHLFNVSQNLIKL